MNRKYLFTLFIIGVVFVSACNKTNVSSNSGSTLPAEVVRIYFESWSNKDYTTQYAQISDGFKDIDPNAKDLETFQKYSIKFFDQAKDIEIVKIEEKLNDGKTASVDYTINILLKDGTKKPFSSTYTLKLREKGWKLIHPYGDNIDNS